MRELFADAGYWIAVTYDDDELHPIARAITDELGDFRIVTTEMVLVELLNYASRLGPHTRKLASDLTQNIIYDENVDVVPQTSGQFREAGSRYADRLDQRWGVTDCASFLLMEQRGITEALAYDRDFEQAGFAALLRDTDESDG
ncbi:MAG: PIN domain-containing protein [Dehalococcoidia bacterium]|nr:PIN domain-containing protein [Dehalococcoidia bacterium]